MSEPIAAAVRRVDFNGVLLEADLAAGTEGLLTHVWVHIELVDMGLGANLVVIEVDDPSVGCASS